MKGRLIQALPWGLVLLFAVLCKSVYDGRRRAEGREAVLVQQNAQLQDTLDRHVTFRDTTYVRDTVVAWKRVRETVTLLDTLLRSDTVVLTQRESVIVFAADSAIQACWSVVLSCEARVAVRDSLISAITWERDHWRSEAQPSLWRQIKQLPGRAGMSATLLAVGFLIGVTR